LQQRAQPKWTKNLKKLTNMGSVIIRQNVERRKPIRRKKESKSEDEVYSHAFFTIDEVALLLRVSKRTVYNLIYLGKLRACKITYHVTIIKKEDFQIMLKENTYNKQETSIFAKKIKAKRESAQVVEEVVINEVETETIPEPKIGTEPTEPHKSISLSSNPLNKGNEESTHKKPRKPKAARVLKPSTDYQQSVKDTFIDSCDEDIYTLADVCRKYKYTYGRFYNLRMKYQIPCVKGHKTKCFPKSLVDKAMTDEATNLGNDAKEHWYTCFDIMRIFGLGKTQVRRFAETHNVRMKKMHGGKRNLYLKADWDDARKKAEAKSTSTKSKREDA